MGQRGQSWLAVLVLCMLLMLTPIIVGAQDDDDAEATPEATTEAVVGEETTEDDAEATPEATTEAVVGEETTEDDTTPQTLFELRAVEEEAEEEEDEPAGVGLLFILLGVGAVGVVGMASIGRENFTLNSDS